MDSLTFLQTHSGFSVGGEVKGATKIIQENGDENTDQGAGCRVLLTDLTLEICQ